MAKKFDFLSPGVEIREIDQSFIPAQAEAEGPIIIGRTRKGPANKPVKVSNLDDFVSVFGLPVAGGNGAQGDMWRDGNMTGPTYASYAAQAWLASEESPVTIVRIAGEEHSSADSNGKAGWSLGGIPTNSLSSNKTAYGLFIIPSSSTNTDQTGTLAAVFYATAGALALSSSDGYQVGRLVPSVGTGAEFKVGIHDAGGLISGEEYVFNLNRTSPKYIRSVFNTNPQLTNADTIESTQLKTYWLGESYSRAVNLLDIESNAAGTVYAIMMPLQSGSAAADNWAYHREGAKEAQSGWVFSQKEKGAFNLFRLKSMHAGEDIQKDYVIAIEDIREPANPLANPWGTFTVAIKTLVGETVEKYTRCNLNPSSQDYVAARIGDQYMDWSDTDRRYRTYGDFQNQSNIVYVEMKQFVKDGGAQGHLPAGFFGPVRPKGFDLVSGSATGAKALGVPTGADFADAFVQGTATYHANLDSGNGEFVSVVTDFTGSFTFPSIALRVSGTDGGAPDPYRAYWGIRPKISATSNTNDSDYCDYLRSLPVGAVNSDGSPANTDAFEYSFTFRLDDIVTGSGNAVYHLDGAHTAGTSYTAQAGKTFGDLLNLGVSQFLMPLHGGSEGFDITEKEPLRLENINSGTDLTNYAKYSINKAIDCIADSEVVPANLLLMPGIYHPTYTDKLMATAERRKDVLAIIDLEDDYIPSAERLDDATDLASLGNVSSAIDSLKARTLNTSYACAFYPWVQIADNLNGGKLVWIPSSVAALGAFGKSQAQSDVWFAPAGFNRGGLGFLGGQRGPKVLQARQRLDSKERDALYEVNINPIATFPAEGVVIFGQKTLQADGSALDRINVRRLLLFLKARVSDVSRNLLFDQNVQSTWNRFKSEVNPILSDVKARFGLADYKLILDETTTTADLVDRNIMYAKIYVKPARAIEYIVVDFVITRTGADFV